MAQNLTLGPLRPVPQSALKNAFRSQLRDTARVLALASRRGSSVAPRAFTKPKRTKAPARKKRAIPRKPARATRTRAPARRQGSIATTRLKNLKKAQATLAQMRRDGTLKPREKKQPPTQANP